MGAYYLRDEAIGRGRSLAIEWKVEHIVRRMDGTIEERNSYGDDPRDVKARGCVVQDLRCRATSLPLAESMAIRQPEVEVPTTASVCTSTDSQESPFPSGGNTCQRADPSSSRHTIRAVWPSVPS